MKVEPITILMSRRERDLISQYGYPFEGIEGQLSQSGEVDLARITDEPFWWEQVIVNLYISGKEITDHDLAIALRNLIDRIDVEIKLIKKTVRYEAR